MSIEHLWEMILPHEPMEGRVDYLIHVLCGRKERQEFCTHCFGLWRHVLNTGKFIIIRRVLLAAHEIVVKQLEYRCIANLVTGWA